MTRRSFAACLTEQHRCSGLESSRRLQFSCNIPVYYTKTYSVQSIDKKAVCSLLCRATSVQWACHCTDQKVVCSLLDRAALVQCTRTGSQSLVLWFYAKMKQSYSWKQKSASVIALTRRSFAACLTEQHRCSGLESSRRLQFSCNILV